MDRTKRAMFGAACLVAVALVMGWFVGRYIPGEPGTPEPTPGYGLVSGNGRAINETVEFQAGSTVELRDITQGTSCELSENDLVLYDESLINSLKTLGRWLYDSPDIDISVSETKAMAAKSFVEWYPEYKSTYEEPYNDSEIVAVTLSITNKSDGSILYWQDLPSFTLWSDNMDHIDDSQGAGAHLDGSFWILNPSFRPYDNSYDDPDYGRYVSIEPGETQNLVIPFRINKNNLKDQTAFDHFDVSDYCIQTVDYDTGTVYRLWL